MTTRFPHDSVGAETLPERGVDGASAVASSASGSFLMAALAAALFLAMLAGIQPTRPSPAGAGVHVFPDGDVAVVLCVVDAAAYARCFAKDDVLAGPLDGTSPAHCGRADRPLRAPCPGGRDCAFNQAAVPANAFGLVLIEPRAPLFGVPRHRLVDAAVVIPDGTSAPPQIVAGVRTLADCFAPSGRPHAIETVVSHRACERGPCRLRHSSVRVVAETPRSTSDLSGLSPRGAGPRGGG